MTQLQPDNGSDDSVTLEDNLVEEYVAPGELKSQYKNLDAEQINTKPNDSKQTQNPFSIVAIGECG